MILLVDNYDSFTYNLVQRIGELGRTDVRVIRNDLMKPQQAQETFKPTHLIISPGPCTPNEAGLSCDYIRHFHGNIPILGVCLGHQCIAQVFGGKVVQAPRLMHGKTSMIRHDSKSIYTNLPNPFQATRYHSLMVDMDGIDKDFDPVSWTQDQDELMGIRSKTHPTEGVQFHPEYKSTVANPHPLFVSFVKAAIDHSTETIA